MRGILVNKMLNRTKTIKALTLSDLSVWSGSALITVIAPLFVLSQIKGATYILLWELCLIFHLAD